MYEKEVDGRLEVAVTDIEGLVPANPLARNTEKIMDYEWIYERVAPCYSTAKNVRTGTNPVVSGIRAAGKIPHFATVSCAFCRRFPEELAARSPNIF